MLEMTYLRDYASFVRNNKLDDFISAYMMNVNSFNIRILQFFAHLSEEQLLERAKEGIVKLLEGIESGNAMREVRQNLERWKNNENVGLPREAISLKDLTLIYSAQKLSLQSFLPYYTRDVSVATQVINEIELYYKQVQEMAVEMLQTIRQEELQKSMESEFKYRDLFENASDLIQIVSPEGKLLYVNRKWSETLGYKLEDFEGKVIYDFIKKSEREKFKNYRDKIISGQTISESITTCFITNKGEEITVEGSTSCKFKNGIPQYTRALFRDITLRLQQEKKLDFYLDQLAEREKNLSDIIESAPDGVIVIDKDNNILLWNPKAQSIFGWTEEEVLRRSLSEIIVPKELRKAHQEGMKRYLETRYPHILNKTIEVPALHKNGNHFHISLTVSHSVQNGKDTFIAFLRDITEQKQNELELENKRKQLEKSNQELEQYAWLTSHDLKEPLRKILTFSDALLKKHQDNVPKDTFNYLNKIHNAATRMGTLIEAVLQYSNVDTSRELFVPTDLNEIVVEVLEDLEISILSKKAVVQVGELPIIHAIPVQMRQLFQNLISNGIKYSKENETPRLAISCERDGDGFKISVKDNGIGFEAQYAEKIFEVFQRLLKTKTYEGTGIGLALCKKIAEAHKGNIYAISETGNGATFVIHLPEVQAPLRSPTF
jgi:PAS domain S-box-containing protein